MKTDSPNNSRTNERFVIWTETQKTHTHFICIEKHENGTRYWFINAIQQTFNVFAHTHILWLITIFRADEKKKKIKK